MRGRGINYDTGFLDGSRITFDPDEVRRELRIIADDLHCTSVRISGGDPERLSIAGRYALEAGLEVWFAPFPTDMSPDAMVPYLRDCARRAEELRKQSDDVVFVTGCEHSLFARGFMPGNTVFERIDYAVESGTLHGGIADEQLTRELNEFLGEIHAAARGEFGGRITYASGKWEMVDWEPFDLVAVDLYRNAAIAPEYAERLRSYRGHGKPLAVIEFGCCTFRGAGDDGGTGWMAVDVAADPPYVRDGYLRDEAEQAGYMRELLELYAAEGVDSAFWFTFASYELPHREDPRYDLDIGAYGIVKMLEDGRGSTYPDMRWEPKEAFHALAEIYARLRDAPVVR